MKIKRAFWVGSGGVVIFACLVATLVVSMMLVGMLLTVENENATVSRSQAWNISMVVAEAGIEDGLALVNKNVGTSTALTNWPGTASADGWTQGSNNTYYVRRQVGTNSTYYDVYVFNTSSNISTIKSTGTVVWTGPAGASNLISRTVQVTTTISSFTQNGPLVKKSITLGGGGYIDGFNSQNPNLSSNGQYDPAKTTADFNITTIASNAVMTTEINVSGTSAIRAHVNTGSNDGINLNGGGVIGDTNWIGPGIEPGWSNNTVNLDPPPDVSAPTGVSWLPLPTETNNTYILTGFGPGETNYYEVPGNFKLSSSEKFVVTNGPVVLIANNFSMSGGSPAIVVSSNADLNFYLGGNKNSLAGQGVVNQSGFAGKVTLWGLPSCTSLSYDGGSPFNGTIYAPEATLTWVGSAAAIGNFTADSINDQGGAAFHIDLGVINPALSPSGYFVTAWREVLP